MKIDELYKIIDLENNDSEIIAMSMVVKDSNSGELTSYFVNEHGVLDWSVISTKQ